MQANTVYHGKNFYLKGQFHEIFLGFFHRSSSPKPLTFPSSKIFEFVRKLANLFTVIVKGQRIFQVVLSTYVCCRHPAMAQATSHICRKLLERFTKTHYKKGGSLECFFVFNEPEGLSSDTSVRQFQSFGMGPLRFCIMHFLNKFVSSVHLFAIKLSTFHFFLFSEALSAISAKLLFSFSIWMQPLLQSVLINKKYTIPLLNR